MNPHLPRLEGPVRDAVKWLSDRIAALEAQAAGIGNVTEPLGGNLDGGMHRLTRVADAEDLDDAVNLRTLEAYVAAQMASFAQPSAAASSEPAPVTQTGFESGCSNPPPNGDLGVLPQTIENALAVVCGTGQEWASLLAPVATQAQREANAEEMVLRMIWHLNQAGFTAGRQRNPSGLLSKDKLTVTIAGVLRAFDVLSINPPSEPIPGVFMIEVFPANYVASTGTPD